MSDQPPAGERRGDDVAEEISEDIEELFETDRPVEEAVAPHRRRNPVQIVAMWVIPAVILGGLNMVGIIQVRAGTGGELERWQPDALGTTWVFAVKQNGEDQGRRTTQVVGKSLSNDGAALAVESRWDQFLGRRDYRSVTYIAPRGNRLLIYGERANGQYQAYDPPYIGFETGFEPGHTTLWEGKFGTEQQHHSTVLLGREPIDVLGARRDDCLHYRNEAILGVGASALTD